MDCPRCSSSDIIKDGFKRGIQCYYCKECGKYFQEEYILGPVVDRIAAEIKFEYE